MAAKRQLVGTALGEFLAGLGIPRLDPVGRTPASGAALSDQSLSDLLALGDPVPPSPGRVDETPATIRKLFDTHSSRASFGLTPDGHLSSHTPCAFDADRAAEQVLTLVEEDLAVDDREEALAATWLMLGYHDHDHPADFGGLLLGKDDGQPRCCYVDVKRTGAQALPAQRTKLELRAQERKFGLMAQTVTRAGGDFAGYPGYGRPGLLATLLINPVSAGRLQAGFAVNWFFGIASNYQASAARWGWGGPRGSRLPPDLVRELERREAKLGAETVNWLCLLEGFGNYGQFRDDSGTWDRERLRATLEAMSFAARYLLMNEDVLEQAQNAAEALQPEGVKIPLRLEDFEPGESLGTYFGKKADAALEAAEAEGRRADAALEAEQLALKAAEAEARRAAAALEAKEVEARRAAAALEAKEVEARRAAAAIEAKEVEARRAAAAIEAKELALRAAEAEARRATAALEAVRAMTEQLDEVARKHDEAAQRLRAGVARRRGKGHADADIAEDLGYSLEEFQRLFPG